MLNVQHVDKIHKEDHLIENPVKKFQSVQSFGDLLNLFFQKFI